MNKIYLTEQEFLKEFAFTNSFSYQLFQHFIQFDIEDENIEDWIWNPFDFETPNFLLSFPDNDDSSLNEISYEDAIQFKRLNTVYGRNSKIEQIIPTH